MSKCSTCGKPMNPVEAMMGPICLSCAKTEHAKVVGKKMK